MVATPATCGALTALALAGTAAASDGAPPVARVQGTEALHAFVTCVEVATLRRDPRALGELLDPRGLTCAGARTPRAEARHELETPGARLHAFFFDTETLRRGGSERAGPSRALSLHDVLVQRSPSRAEVVLAEGELPTTATVRWTPGDDEPAVALSLCLHEGAWWICGRPGC
jgi:hypothetical protein